MQRRQETDRVAGIFTNASMNIGDCRDIGWGEMWQRFRSVYEGRDRYTETELRKIHNKWKQLTREIETGK